MILLIQILGNYTLYKYKKAIINYALRQLQIFTRDCDCREYAAILLKGSISPD